MTMTQISQILAKITAIEEKLERLERMALRMMGVQAAAETRSKQKSFGEGGWTSLWDPVGWVPVLEPVRPPSPSPFDPSPGVAR
jgi:hypothetical protein